MSIDALEAEIERATAPLRARQAAAAQERADILARSRLVPGAAVIIEVAQPDEGVAAGQIGRIVRVEKSGMSGTGTITETAIVSTKGTTRPIEVCCLLADLHWIPS